ncbi:hypothetical protein COO60DRAFT_1058731 [Scenedesmus sp. NREL 46B-D3]|nr:hypothetical protein COO60DRAFT_1058731 [Scenedesmus sp. NREL 46B-D3]
MVATISAAADQYHHSVNTLKYADRAKEIKTHVVQNVGSVERHITDYQNIIDNLQTEVQSLKARLADKPPAAGLAGSSEAAARGAGSCLPDDSRAGPGPASSACAVGADCGALSSGAAVCSSAEAETLAWIDALAQEINENVEERINLQKALFELEDINVCNQYELQHIEDVLAAEAAANAEEAAEAHERKAVLLEEVQDNNGEASRYRADIAANEACRREIQAKIETAIDANSNVNFLKILSTFRIQAVRLQELKFQMAVRDQIISEQRDVISNLWAILGASGLTRRQVQDIARTQGIVMQGLERDTSDELASSCGSLAAADSAHPSVLGSVSLDGVRGATNLALPGGPVNVQQSLMGGKARFRYRFWQQYQTADSMHSSSGSPIQSVHLPVLLQDHPQSHRARMADPAAPTAATAAAAAAAQKRSSKGAAVKPPTFPALHNHSSPDLLPTGKQLQHPPRSASPLRRQPQPAQQTAGSSSHSHHHQSHPNLQQQQLQQQQHRRGLVKRSASDVSPERMRPGAAAGGLAVAAAHQQHSQQHLQPQASAALSSLKRLHMLGHETAATQTNSA